MIQLYGDWLANADMVREDMERLLDYFSGSKPPMVRFSPTVWEPAIDVYETDNELVVIVELPGVKETDFEVLVDRDTFTIWGKRGKESQAGGKKVFHQVEIQSGSFKRSIALPAPVDTTDAKASYENGLVEIILPKAVENRTFKVKVNAPDLRKPSPEKEL